MLHGDLQRTHAQNMVLGHNYTLLTFSSSFHFADVAGSLQIEGTAQAYQYCFMTSSTHHSNSIRADRPNTDSAHTNGTLATEIIGWRANE